MTSNPTFVAAQSPAEGQVRLRLLIPSVALSWHANKDWNPQTLKWGKRSRQSRTASGAGHYQREVTEGGRKQKNVASLDSQIARYCELEMATFCRRKNNVFHRLAILLMVHYALCQATSSSNSKPTLEDSQQSMQFLPGVHLVPKTPLLSPIQIRYP